MTNLLYKFVTNVPAPGFEDRDHTEEFLECGTNININGEGWGMDNVPITKAYVKDEVLYMQAEGKATFK